MKVWSSQTSQGFNLRVPYGRGTCSTADFFFGETESKSTEIGDEETGNSGACRLECMHKVRYGQQGRQTHRIGGGTTVLYGAGRVAGIGCLAPVCDRAVEYARQRLATHCWSTAGGSLK